MFRVLHPRVLISGKRATIPCTGSGPDQPAEAMAAELSLGRLSGELADPVLRGDLPCTIEVADGRRESAFLSFALTLPSADRSAERTPGPKFLRLSIVIAGEHFEVTDDWFEDGVLRLDQAVHAAGARLVC